MNGLSQDKNANYKIVCQLDPFAIVICINQHTY